MELNGDSANATVPRAEHPNPSICTYVRAHIKSIRVNPSSSLEIRSPLSRTPFHACTPQDETNDDDDDDDNTHNNHPPDI